MSEKFNLAGWSKISCRYD